MSGSAPLQEEPMPQLQDWQDFLKKESCSSLDGLDLPAMSWDIFSQSSLLRALSRLALNVSRDGASTASLGNLCQ